MKTFTINGSHLNNLDDFYDTIEKLFLQNIDFKFGRNLDAFSDILSGGFGSFDEEEKIEIIWKDFEVSRKNLKNIDIIEEIITEQEHIILKKA
ncbi:MAG: barstar family protein [Candidatus Altimarinota bacterium]